MPILLTEMCKDELIIERARKKAGQSICKFNVAAIGINRAGIPVMSRANRPRFNGYGGGYHAERLVMEQAKAKGIVRIIVCRIGKAGNLLPIQPCKVCQKIADKLGIELVSIPEEEKEELT